MKKQSLRPLFLALSILLLSASCMPANKPKTVIEQSRQPIQVTNQVLGIDQYAQQFNFYVDENKNALDILKSGHQVETKTFSGAGEFVESINSNKADSKHFWEFLVNGKSSNVGAGSYAPKDKDRLEWQLTEIK